MQNIVSEHEQYLDALRDFNDWLISAKEELQRWSDLSGDSVSIKRKLSKVQVRNLNCYTLEKVLYVAPGHIQLRDVCPPKHFRFPPGSSACQLLPEYAHKEAQAGSSVPLE